MMNLDFLDSLFFDETFKLYDMKKGLTNKNYMIETQKQQYVLRVPRFDADKIVNRHHETLALQAIEHTGIDVDLIYYDEASGYKVTRYLKDAQTFDTYQGSDKIMRTALLMRRFHRLNCQIHAPFDPLGKYQQYRKQIKTLLYDITPYEYILEEIKLFSNPQCLCHNDWVGGNILFDKDRTYLIDYEYAGDNDPLFDVMSFLSENNIYDPAQRACFYQYYFDDFTETIQHQLHIWETFHNVLWCAWAMMMFDNRQEECYREIASIKYQALQKM